MKLLLQNIMKIPIVYIMSDAKITPENHNHLVSKGMLTNGCKYVCNNCLKYATDYLSEETGKEVPFTLVMKELMIVQITYQQSLINQ